MCTAGPPQAAQTATGTHTHTSTGFKQQRRFIDVKAVDFFHERADGRCRSLQRAEEGQEAGVRGRVRQQLLNLETRVDVVV